MLRRRACSADFSAPSFTEVVMACYTFPKYSPRLGPTGILNLADNNSTGSGGVQGPMYSSSYYELRVLTIITKLDWSNTVVLKGNRGTDIHGWRRNFITSINVPANMLRTYQTAAAIGRIAASSPLKKYFDNEPSANYYSIRIDNCYQGGAQTFVCIIDPETTERAVSGILITSILVGEKEYPVRMDESYLMQK